MKRTVNVNIGSMAFTVDEDAYQALGEYLDQIAVRLAPDERDEVLGDVEARLADLFREGLSVPGQVVSLALVRRSTTIIGGAECFGDDDAAQAAGNAAAADGPAGGAAESSGQSHNSRVPGGTDASGRAQDEPRRLYRSRTDTVLGGVCGGLAEYMDWDPSLVRIAAVILGIATFAVGVFAYLIFWLVIPQEPEQQARARQAGKPPRR